MQATAALKRHVIEGKKRKKKERPYLNMSLAVSYRDGRINKLVKVI